MNKYLLALGFFVLIGVGVHAQKKSDLIAEIDVLKKERDSIKSLVITAQKNERVSTAKADSYELQVQDLQSANATLLKNLNSFAEVSNKNSENVNRAMASLEAKESQLKAITGEIAKNDSTALMVLTNAKQTLGENANIGVLNGAVIISSKLESLFGSDTGTTITATSEEFIGKIANILKANPETAITIEGLSMTGDLVLPAKQAQSVANVLQSKFEIDPNRIATYGRDGNLKEGVLIKIHPKFDAFYLMVREHMKN
ncbi:MAG: OmpA family protein [Flavobacteriaceae bacterium]